MRKVKYAKLHVNLFIAGLGDLGTVLPSPSKTFSGITMSYGENADGAEGLHINVRGFEVTVPPASTAYVIYTPLEDKKPLQMAKASANG